MKDLGPLRRHYDKFTAPERDRLVLAALEREDWEQIRALLERCPAADALSHLWNVVVLGHLVQGLALHLLACDALFYRHLARQSRAQQRGPPPSAAPDPAPLQEQAAAAWFGFVAWCQAAGYDPHQLLNLVLPGSAETDPARALINRQVQGFQSCPDPLQVDHWHTAFACLFWRLALDPG